MDGGAAQRIAALCIWEPGTRVVEIGAGTGALTTALVGRGARTTAIEIDPKLVEILREREDLREAEILEADALEFDYASIAGDWCAAGNLPYNIATPLVLGWIESASPPQRIVVMVQRDVADRFIAKPATPAYGRLTLAVQYAYDIRRAFVLGPGAFFPRPAVDSAVVVMQRLVTPAVTVRDRSFLVQVVRAGFAYRRKTLANSLALAMHVERERVQAALTRLGFDTEIRGEQLDLKSFAALADDLAP